MDIAARIKQCRGKLSQDEFSELLAVHKNSIGRYERGDSTPDMVFAQNVCTKLGVSSEWLLFGRGPMRPGEEVLEASTQDVPTAIATHESACARCTKLEARLDEVERERRELTAENRHLWKDNGELREKCARLEERQFQRNVGHGDNDAAGSAG